METINNMASAAAKAVWGEGEANREPISGAKGDVSKGEPYDAGNLETPQQEKVEDKLSAGAIESMPATRATESAGMENAAFAKTENQPSQSAEEPPLLTQDELKNAGPGPRPLEVVAKEHGGNAGEISVPTSESRKENTLGETPASENQLDPAQTQSSSHLDPVKATGLAADGGDFDATKPGAGADADRLMGEKGLSRDEGSNSKSGGNEGSKSPSSGKEKPSLGERIKAKFHKH